MYAAIIASSIRRARPIRSPGCCAWIAAACLALPVRTANAVTAEETLTLGTLSFSRCELAEKHSGATTAAWCAPFKLPENRAAPDTRMLEMRLALIRSEATLADPDPVVFLAGGPGQAATESYPLVAAALKPLRAHRHIVLLDQRGTGGSNALICSSAKDQLDAGASGVDPEQMRRTTRDCLAQVSEHSDPRFYTTSDAIEDLEALRQALGAPRLNLIGGSYGTRMAQQYAMHKPQGVRSIVLDSVVPNELALGAEFARNLDEVLAKHFVQCAQTPECAKAFGDTADNLRKLRAQLRTRVPEVSFRDPTHFGIVTRHFDEYTLGAVLRLYAYAPESSALLPLSIARALNGDYAPLAGQVRMLSDSLDELGANQMQLSVICSEDADLLAPRVEDPDSVLGNHIVDALLAGCEIWPHGARPNDFHQPFKSAIPVLLIEGEFDPVTPPRYGEQVLSGLSNARLLVVKGQGHTPIGRGCLPKLVARFVDELHPKQLDAACLDALGPVPAFIDFNGAAP